ncbi:hypothetical protein VOLCADRAFT_91076 [Volvox carteri f. nagariensis]|uniref:Uncharacterized protein n=1 Tax=Volvox carteri f. nagariensis TaxID=3068 RepID=D8TW42_VOLCA|nr:uncharacterized protein VOLCADRAFT_91076 [Volvox carteri f. nagariensis]EFJ48304.1 hypothetical protein VOLCADRAFT_91076 [Volvox carteri f. nagariensis]|eukprot:XP_002950558.1 hypothetical protein VOLCADRAFT_91076 [Volvox carteri f. nagariensis]
MLLPPSLPPSLGHGCPAVASPPPGEPFMAKPASSAVMAAAPRFNGRNMLLLQLQFYSCCCTYCCCSINKDRGGGDGGGGSAATATKITRTCAAAAAAATNSLHAFQLWGHKTYKHATAHSLQPPPAGGVGVVAVVATLATEARPKPKPHGPARPPLLLPPPTLQVAAVGQSAAVAAATPGLMATAAPKSGSWAASAASAIAAAAADGDGDGDGGGSSCLALLAATADVTAGWLPLAALSVCWCSWKCNGGAAGALTAADIGDDNDDAEEGGILCINKADVKAALPPLPALAFPSVHAEALPLPPPPQLPLAASTSAAAAVTASCGTS